MKQPKRNKSQTRPCAYFIGYTERKTLCRWLMVSQVVCFLYQWSSLQHCKSNMTMVKTSWDVTYKGLTTHGHWGTIGFSWHVKLRSYFRETWNRSKIGMKTWIPWRDHQFFSFHMRAKFTHILYSSPCFPIKLTFLTWFRHCIVRDANPILYAYIVLEVDFF